MRNIYVVVERGDEGNFELPDSVWATRKAAEAKAKQLGGEDEGVVVQEYGLLGED